jgi:membrane-associated protease RseP (regulator of RpoE activity)
MALEPFRPRISRETRLLLLTAVIALAALWVLARLRFPDRPVTPNPVPPLLSQLAAGSSFGGLAEEIAQIQPRVAPLVRAVDTPLVGVDGTATVQALEIDEELAVTVTPAALDRRTAERSGLLARDPASGLTVIRIPPTAAPAPGGVVPQRLEQPRYAVGTDIVNRRIVLRPVFVGALESVVSPLWSEPIWLLPAGTDVSAGSFLFTSTADLLGLVTRDPAGLAVVPAAALLVEVNRLLATQPSRPPGDLGIEVQALTPTLVAATGAAGGVVVTWVDPEGPAADALVPGDVIEAAAGELISSRAHWEARRARITGSESVPLLVRRAGTVLDVTLEARAGDAETEPGGLGAALRAAGTGTIVLRVAAGSPAARAGLQPGDLITRIGDQATPSPRQVNLAFEAATPERPVVVAITRDTTHRILALAP